jgi:MtN3 and saliva related transmembrane protein
LKICNSQLKNLPKQKRKSAFDKIRHFQNKKCQSFELYSLKFGIFLLFENMTEVIGWASSLILLLTLVRQVYKQWKDGETEGVSSWLFIGQLLASVGFTVYSYLVGNWVFTITNGILTINNLIGIGLYFYFSRKNNDD